MAAKKPVPQKIVLERTFDFAIERVWTAWTTQRGIEAWWGPDGFVVKVRKLDLVKGGELVYDMIATGAEQIAFMKQAGMPLSQMNLKIRFDEVIPPKRLAYTNRVDFIPGHAPYDVGTLVELHADGKKTRLVLTLDPMHAEEWSQRAKMGWEQELGKLAKALAAGRPVRASSRP
jgi:uncharacterized protein YndB with AHSA1/START domain